MLFGQKVEFIDTPLFALKLEEVFPYSQDVVLRALQSCSSREKLKKFM